MQDLTPPCPDWLRIMVVHRTEPVLRSSLATAGAWRLETSYLDDEGDPMSPVDMWVWSPDSVAGVAANVGVGVSEAVEAEVVEVTVEDLVIVVVRSSGHAASKDQKCSARGNWPRQ